MYRGFISALHGFPNGMALEVGRPTNSNKSLFSEHDIELELLKHIPRRRSCLAGFRVRPYARERHVLTHFCLLTGDYLATVLTKVILNQILSQTTFQALIPGLPA